MTSIGYLIGTCLGCKKCLYCGVELSLRQKMCTCDKTVKPSTKNRTGQVKTAFSRISKPDLPPKQLEYIQESVTRFGYSLDLTTTFNFAFCSTCNSTFQRRKYNATSKSSTSCNINLELSSNRNSPENDEPVQLKNNIIDLNEFDDEDNDLKISEISKMEQVISFNLIVKLSTGVLPSKWMEIEVSSLDDILADIHYYVTKLTGDGNIMHSDYLISFKPEKAAGVRTQLVDMQDYKKFLLDYKKLTEKKKNMTIVVSLKKDKKEKRKEIVDSEDSENENIKSQKKKKKGIPKLDNFSEILQQEGRIIRELREQYKCGQHDACFVDDRRHIKLTAMHLQCWAKEIIRETTDNIQMPNLPIFSQSNSIKTFTTPTPVAPNSNFNTPSFFFTIPPQMFSFMQNSTPNNPSNSPSNVLSSPRKPVPSLDEFFIKLDELLGNNGELITKFKHIFEEEQITVNQIYDLTDMEFDQLGVNKIGWRKAFRAAAKNYK